MAATLDTLKLQYANLLRVDAAHIPASDLAALDDLAARLDAGQIGPADALAAVGRLSQATTQVAVFSYQFFTGQMPSLAGLDYLVSPTGPNPNNLNSAYYAPFNTGNRYINFAINLAKGGEGTAAFQAAYGALSLEATFDKAYLTIFGAPAAAGQAHDTLNTQVADGFGGTFTRADYFATYGGDGLSGIGTKAGLIGWLLSVAAAADVGAYAYAYDVFAKDLAADGVARVQNDLLDAYGEGATITVAHDQSVSPLATDPALRATAGDDHVTGTSGLDAVQSVATGAGADTIEISGGAGVSGLIDAGPGDDRIVVDVLKSPAPVLGVSQNGSILAGSGNDYVEITQEMQPGAVIDGGDGYDTFKGGALTPLNLIPLNHVRGFEEMILNFGGDLAGVSGLQALRADASTGYIQFVLNSWINVPSGTPVTLSNTGPTPWSINYVDGTVDAELHLQDVHGYVTGTFIPFGSFFRPAQTNIVVGGATGTLNVHLDGDTELGVLTWSGDTIVLSGPGRFVGGAADARVAEGLARFDASATNGVDLRGLNIGGPQASAILSAHDDKAALSLMSLSNTTFTLGGGADVLTFFAAGRTDQFNLLNMKVENGQVTTFATVTDFQKGVDLLDLGPAVVLTAGAQGYVAGAATLEQALVALSPHVAAQTVAIFELGGDTWVYRQNGNVGVDTGDGLIRLVGQTGLSVATGSASGDIHWG